MTHGISNAKYKLKQLELLLHSVGLKLELILTEPLSEGFPPYKASISLTQGSCWFRSDKNPWVKEIRGYRENSVICEACDLLITQKNIIYVVVEEGKQLYYKEFQFDGQKFIKKGYGTL